jgi:hypothetical protein
MGGKVSRKADRRLVLAAAGMGAEESDRLHLRPEQFQQNWEPVLRPELRLNKKIEHFR